MTVRLLERWPHQLFTLAEVSQRIAAGFRRVLVTRPTGGGKSVIVCDLILWALENGYKVILYTNRKLLVRQLTRVLRKHGITFGVRAAGLQGRAGASGSSLQPAD